jgi:hypothetical protein
MNVELLPGETEPRLTCAGAGLTYHCIITDADGQLKALDTGLKDRQAARAYAILAQRGARKAKRKRGCTPLQEPLFPTIGITRREDVLKPLCEVPTRPLVAANKPQEEYGDDLGF